MRLEEISSCGVAYIIASNNQEVLQNTCLASPDIASGSNQVIVAERFTYSGLAYNYGIRKATEPILCFVHQDVYLPQGWQRRLAEAIRVLRDKSPRWAVLGIVGVNGAGQIRGRCWSNGLQRQVGGILPEPISVDSIDELVIVLRRNCGLFFDENLPGFHFYGTDIVQTAKDKGYGAYVFDAPVIHNSLPVVRWGSDIVATYKYMQRKWKHRLPLQTTITTITSDSKLLWKHWVQGLLTFRKRTQHSRLLDPALKARELGYE